MILYLTYNDPPSGVLRGQCIDVVKHWSSELGEESLLLSFISLRNYSETKEKFKQAYKPIHIRPMFPRISNWRKNKFLLKRFCKKHGVTAIFGRGVFATNLALDLRDEGIIKRVGFDGRGAYVAEWEEYNVGQNEGIVSEMHALEKRAVRESDARLGVSEALVDYWRKRYDYNASEHNVVPCTYSEFFKEEKASSEDLRSSLGYQKEDTVLVYSGSSAGWQSFQALEKWLRPILAKNPDVKVLFLSRKDKNNQTLLEKFPSQVQIAWVAQNEVKNYLSAGDFGLLLREKSVTNEVASPTKFAEYLQVGLPVLITEGIGDYSALVREKSLGYVVDMSEEPETIWSKSDASQRQLNQQFAVDHFSKKAHSAKYRMLIDRLSV